jgi:phosphoribosylglycinamide formyltransferase-1
VLISGRGSNLQALVRALRNSDLPLPTLHVLSNVAEAPGLEWARSEGLSTAVVGHRDYAQREAFDAALLGEILAFAPDLVVLAGFMRILSPGFCDALAGRLINIHPSLLPVFTGLDTHRRALAAGVRLHGATVHAVTAELDHGPILAQGVVPVFHDDTPERLAARVLEIEHQLYPAAVRAILAGDICWTATGWHFLHPERFAPLLLHPLLMGSGPLPLQDALSAT